MPAINPLISPPTPFQLTCTRAPRHPPSADKFSKQPTLQYTTSQSPWSIKAIHPSRRSRGAAPATPAAAFCAPSPPLVGGAAACASSSLTDWLPRAKLPRARVASTWASVLVLRRRATSEVSSTSVGSLLSICGEGTEQGGHYHNNGNGFG